VIPGSDAPMASNSPAMLCSSLESSHLPDSGSKARPSNVVTNAAAKSQTPVECSRPPRSSAGCFIHRLSAELPKSVKCSRGQTLLGSTLAFQSFIKEMQLTTYRIFPHAQVAEFPVGQPVAEAFILEQEKRDLGTVERQGLISRLDSFDLL
jgi:hypothetical protein